MSALHSSSVFVAKLMTTTTIIMVSFASMSTDAFVVLKYPANIQTWGVAMLPLAHRGNQRIPFKYGGDHPRSLNDERRRCSQQTLLPEKTSTSMSMATEISSEVGRDLSSSSKLVSKQESEPESSKLRPLHQHWWPVATLDSLSTTQPNAIQVLGQPLVVYCSNNQQVNKEKAENKPSPSERNWVVLNDRCTHRFAPLSEGRIVPSSKEDDCVSAEDCNHNNIQCAYHGWEFNKQGNCVKVPQISNTRSIQPSMWRVERYPTQVKAGILWLWMDPKSYQSLGVQTDIPISPVLQEYLEFYGETSCCCFMRDLPYGTEILGENLLDLSHLPFSHHGVGMLKREIGGELPMKLMNQTEKEQYAEWEQDYWKAKRNSNLSKLLEQKPATTKPSSLNGRDERVAVPIPTLQTRIVDAAENDPIFRGLRKMLGQVGNKDDAQDWECTVSFFEPNHVRYRRIRPGDAPQMHVELFFCPLTPGRSRVFLFNALASLHSEKDESPSEGDTKKASIAKRRPLLFEPKKWKARMRSKVFGWLFDPRKARSHMTSHLIFDGDGIFLHQQGRRMAQQGLTYRNYTTPGSCDILMNGFRRYMQEAAKATEKYFASGDDRDRLTGQQFVQSAVGTTPNAYQEQQQQQERSVLLDRFTSHTMHCSTCQREFHRWKRLSSMAHNMAIAVQGAAGAATALVVLTLNFIMTHPQKGQSSMMRPLFGWSLRTTVTLSVLAWTMAWIMQKARHRCNAMAQKFVFQDYVHAEKN